DPESRFVNKSDLKPIGKVWTVFENGPASEKVDLLIIGEGYTDSELPKFHKDVQRLSARLFETEPFKSHKKSLNVRAIDLPAGARSMSSCMNSDITSRGWPTSTTRRMSRTKRAASIPSRGSRTSPRTVRIRSGRTWPTRMCRCRRRGTRKSSRNTAARFRRGG